METLKESIIKKIELIKKNQEIRKNRILEEENKQKIYSAKISNQIEELENDINNLQDKIFLLEKNNLNIDKDYLLKEEYIKNENIMNNNIIIKKLENELKVIENKIELGNKYYEKQILVLHNKNKVELEKLKLFDIEKKNKIKLIEEKFDNMKNEKAQNYNTLLIKKEELIEKEISIKNKLIHDKQTNLKVRFQNINTIMKYNNNLKDLGKKEKEFVKKIDESNYELFNFEKNTYYLEKEKILLGLKNNLLENENQFKINFISNEKYFSNSKEINNNFEIKLRELDNKLEYLKTNNRKIKNEFNNFKIYKSLKNDSLGNQIKKGSKKYEELKKYQKELKILNYELNEFNIITKNIDNLKEEEIQRLNIEYNRSYYVQKIKSDDIDNEIIKLENEKNEKIDKINSEKDKVLNKISYFKYSNHNINIAYELKIKNFVSNVENKETNLEEIKNKLYEKQNLYKYKKQKFEEYNDNYDLNKLKKETNNNNLLIEELLQIQELNKKLDEL